MRKELLNYTGVKLWISGNQVYLLKPIKRGSYFSAFIDSQNFKLTVDTLSIYGYSKSQVRRICLQVFGEIPEFHDNIPTVKISEVKVK